VAAYIIIGSLLMYVCGTVRNQTDSIVQQFVKKTLIIIKMHGMYVKIIEIRCFSSRFFGVCHYVLK